MRNSSKGHHQFKALLQKAEQLEAPTHLKTKIMEEVTRSEAFAKKATFRFHPAVGLSVLAVLVISFIIAILNTGWSTIDTASWMNKLELPSIQLRLKGFAPLPDLQGLQGSWMSYLALGLCLFWLYFILDHFLIKRFSQPNSHLSSSSR